MGQPVPSVPLNPRSKTPLFSLPILFTQALYSLRPQHESLPEESGGASPTVTATTALACHMSWSEKRANDFPELRTHFQVTWREKESMHS
jgi:hypothetical protein